MNELIIFRSPADGFLYYSINGVIQPLELFQDNVFKIKEPFSTYKNLTEYNIVPIQTADQIPTYKLQTRVVLGGGGRRSSSSSSGTTLNPVYGQVYTKTTQTVNSNSPVVWDAVQNASGVTLSGNDIKVSDAGKYQIEWVLEIKRVAIPG